MDRNIPLADEAAAGALKTMKFTESPIMSTYLLAFIVASFLFSLAAGYVTALAAKSKPVQHAFALGIVQVLLGIAFEVSYWEMLPVWYHLVFLALLLPGNVLGGVMRARQRPAPQN